MTSKTSAYGEDPLDHNVPIGDGHNENEHHGEKQSLFKKVKAKAKKIKDGIKGHGGHGDDQDLDHDDVDENDNEIDTNPAIHGAHAARGVDIGKEDTAGQHGTDIGGKTTIDGINVRKDGSAGQHGTDIDEKTAVGGHAPVSYAGVDQGLNPTTTDYVPGQEETLGESRIDTLEPLGSGNKPHALNLTPDIAQSTGSHSSGNMGVTQKPKPGGILEKDSQVLKHVGELGALTGGGIAQTVLTKEGISSPRGTDIAEGTTLGDHSPVGSPGVDQHQNMSGSPDISTNLSSRGLHDEHEQKPKSYTEKVSALASELANKAKVSTGYGVSDETPVNVSASPVDQPSFEEQNPLVGGYSDTHQKMSTGSHDQFSPEPVTAHQFDSTNPSGEAKPESYTEKISSLATELATKAKVATGYGVSNETPTNASTAPLGETNKGVSMKEYLAEKLKPGEEDKALSEVITEALPLHTPKEKHPDSQVTESDQEKEVVVVKGRVTESEEVANRLGRAEDKDYDGVGPGLASPGKSVMNRIMDATGSWFGGKSDPATEPVVSSAEGNANTQDNPYQGNSAVDR